MIISIPVFMITLKWIQDFHLAFEPMGVYMNTICSNVPVPEECMSVCLVTKYFFFRSYILIPTLYLMELSVSFFNMTDLQVPLPRK